MNTVDKLNFLLDAGADKNRVSDAARSVLAKIILSLPPGEMSLQLIALRDSL